MILSDSKVCISGVGVVSPVGEKITAHKEFLLQNMPASSYRIEGVDVASYIKRRYLRPLDAVTIHCIAMASAALQDAGVEAEDLEPSRTGIVIGSMYAGIGCIFDFKRACYEGRTSDYLGLSPLYFPGIVFNSLSGQPAIEYRFTGPNAVVNAGFTSGLLSVIKGAEYILSGQADVVIAGGAEMAHPFLDEKYQCRRSDTRLEQLESDFHYSEAVCLFLLHRSDDPRFPDNGRYASVSGMRYGFLPEDGQEDALRGEIQKVTEHLDAPPDTVVRCANEDSLLGKRESAALELALGGKPILLNNKRHFGHALGAAGSLNLLQGVVASGSGNTLVNSLDPSGNFALITIERQFT